MTRWCRRRRSALLPGQVRDATAAALAGLVTGAGGEPVPLGIVGDDADDAGAGAARRAEPLRRRGGLRRVLGRCPGRDRRRGGPARAPGDPLPRAGRCDRASRPCWPTAAGCPSIGLPGNPLSALVVFRLVGLPRRPPGGGTTVAPPEPTVRARLDRQVPSPDRPAGRRAGPGHRSADGPVAEPAVRRLGAAVGADLGRRLAGRARGRPPGCPPAPRSTSRCTDDRQPVRPATSRPRRRRRPGSGPGRTPAARRASRPSPCRVAEAARPGHRRAGLGPPVVARLRRRGHGRHRGARGRHLRREREHAAACSRPATSTSSTPATRCPTAGTRWSCARTCTAPPAGEAELRAAVAPWTHVRLDRRGRRGRRAAAARRPPAAAVRPGGGGRGRRHRPRGAARAAGGRGADRRRDPAGRRAARPRARSRTPTR